MRLFSAAYAKGDPVCTNVTNLDWKPEQVQSSFAAPGCIFIGYQNADHTGDQWYDNNFDNISTMLDPDTGATVPHLSYSVVCNDPTSISLAFN